MVRGPMIAEVMAGWRRTNAMAISTSLIPASSASVATGQRRRACAGSRAFPRHHRRRRSTAQRLQRRTGLTGPGRAEPAGQLDGHIRAGRTDTPGTPNRPALTRHPERRLRPFHRRRRRRVPANGAGTRRGVVVPPGTATTLAARRRVCPHRTLKGLLGIGASTSVRHENQTVTDRYGRYPSAGAVPQCSSASRCSVARVPLGIHAR
jgi:hypothetical protein